jgi:hypothetical protein
MVQVYDTSNPSMNLVNTNSILRLSAATGSGYYSAWAVAGDAVIRNESGKLLFQYSGFGGAIVINTSNYVGIGTNSMNNQLTVGASASPAANSVGTTNALIYGNINLWGNRIIFSNATTDFNHSIYNNTNNNDNEGAFNGLKYDGYSGHWFRINSAGLGTVPTTGMFINSSAQVGIGTTTVKGAFHIYEASGTYAAATGGSLTISHGNGGGTSSIVFPSKYNYGSDRGTISYYDSVSGTAYTDYGSTGSALVFGCYDDGANSYGTDAIVLNPSGNIAFVPGSYTYFTGNVGIGVTNPSYKLQISGNAYFAGGLILSGSVGNYATAGISYAASTILALGDGVAFPYASGGTTTGITLYSNGHFLVNGAIFWASDQRIKTNIQPAPELLPIIRQFPFVSYDYIFHDPQKSHCSFGLIAQEVAKIYPEAVEFQTNFIPNLLQSPIELHYHDPNGKFTECLFDKPVDLVIGDTIRYLIYYNDDLTTGKEVECIVSFVSDNKTHITIPMIDQHDKISQLIFYGKRVNDFHTLDKTSLMMLGLAGVKELSSIMKRHDTILQSLEQEIESIQHTLSSF